MDRFSIQGPCRLEGSIEASGAKNAALPALATALLTQGDLRLRRVPRVRDIATMLEVLGHLGVEHRWTDEDLLELMPTAAELPPDDAPWELVKKMRASVLVLGPLVARRGHARVSLPGGCAIGVRPIDQHLAGLEALGAEIRLEHGYVEARTRGLRGADFRFAMPTVTGTENLMMAASLARGGTRLRGCAREPEIVDLADLLRTMGAQIEGDGTDTIEIEGRPELGGGAHDVIVDRIEAGTYLIGAALTRGAVEVIGARPAHLGAALEKLAELGAEVTETDDGLRVAASGPLRGPCAIRTAPHPGFPTDLQAQFMVLLTCTEGVSTVEESIFENRFQHVAELARMGARIELADRLATIHGPSQLSGAHVMATDLRASASLVLAGLVADGETLVHRIYHLDRGYVGMEAKLQQLGATVARVPGPPTP